MGYLLPVSNFIQTEDAPLTATKAKPRTDLLPVSADILAALEGVTRDFESQFDVGAPIYRRARLREIITDRFPDGHDAISAWCMKASDLPTIPKATLHWHTRPEINNFGSNGYAVYSRFTIEPRKS
jgi:hypothetical protein